MKKLLLLSFFFLFFTAAFAQNPLVKQWDKRFGGTHVDDLTTLNRTNDNGIILGGYSYSLAGGDKTQNTWGGLDYWMVKLDSSGNKQWDNDFGGTGGDVLYALQQTIDNGYILGGWSFSGISGDKTQPTQGSYDYWILKTDSLGTKLWDKTFGGSIQDELFSLQQTTDGGFILGGISLSGISGDKTEANWDSTGYTSDYWVLKTDSLGNKEWDKDFGGTNFDILTTILQTIDGGYLVGGFSRSGISGNKTIANWDSSEMTSDYWVVKLDSLGNKQWEKTYGGIAGDHLYSMQPAPDGGYILGGLSWSPISGNKTQDTIGSIDYWLVKIDFLGNKQWDKVLGAFFMEDYVGNIAVTSDNGYLIAGTSYSQAGGDKTENNMGPEQTWVVKTDSLGNKQWDKTLLTNTSIDDEVGFAIQTNDGCYVMANSTAAGIGGNKSQPSQGAFDYWLIKFCDSTLTSTSNISQTSGFNVYPNPFTDKLAVSLSPPLWGGRVGLYDIFGRKVFSQQLTTANNKLQTSNLSKGIYFLEVITTRERVVKKVVKQ